MSLEDYKSRFAEQVKYLDTLAQFLSDIESDANYSADMSDIYAQEVVVPYLREIIDDLGDEAHYRQFIENVGGNTKAVRIMDAGNLWADLMTRMDIFLQNVEFSYIAELVEYATPSAVWSNALMHNCVVVTEMYEKLFGYSKASISREEMLDELRGFDAEKNLEIIVNLILNCPDDDVVDFCGGKLLSITYNNGEHLRDSRMIEVLHKLKDHNGCQFAVVAVDEDDAQLRNMHATTRRQLTLDKWVDEGLIGLFGRDVMSWTAHRDRIKGALERNPTVLAMARSMVKNDDIQPEGMEEGVTYSRLIIFSLHEMVLPAARRTAEKVRRSPSQHYFLMENLDF